MASQVSGSDLVVAVYDETAYGETPGTPDGRLICFRSLDIQPNEELLVDDTICSAQGRGVARPGRGGVAPSGNISVAVDHEQIGFWLKHLFGTPQTTGSDPYTHVFTPVELLPGFIVEKDYTADIASKIERFRRR